MCKVFAADRLRDNGLRHEVSQVISDLHNTRPRKNSVLGASPEKMAGYLCDIAPELPWPVLVDIMLYFLVSRRVHWLRI
jgi:hypothetical protein